MSAPNCVRTSWNEFHVTVSEPWTGPLWSYSWHESKHEEMALLSCLHVAVNGPNKIYLWTWELIMLLPWYILSAPALKLDPYTILWQGECIWVYLCENVYQLTRSIQQFHEPRSSGWLDISCFSVSSPGFLCPMHLLLFFTVCTTLKFQFHFGYGKYAGGRLVSPWRRWSLLTLIWILRCWCITIFYKENFQMVSCAQYCLKPSLYVTVFPW